MTFKSVNPATGKLIAEYGVMSMKEVASSASACRAASTAWARIAPENRAIFIADLSKALLDGRDDYAGIITSEMGKPIREARAEVEKCAFAARYFADEAPGWLADELLGADGVEHLATFEPLGVILAVMPWNYPFWQLFRFAIPALAAGNGILLKHAKNVSGCAIALERVFRKAGFPENLVKTILTDHSTIAEVIGSDLVDAVTLTGSVQAGGAIGGIAGANIKKVVLELGGSDPYIVFQDADLEKAAVSAAASRFQNCGQTCIAAKRFIVHENLFESFLEALVSAADRLRIGDPMLEETELGPLAYSGIRDDLILQVDDARRRGAVILTGCEPIFGEGSYFSPGVIRSVRGDMKIMSEEVFGPVAPVVPFKTSDEAVRIANATEYGLGASIWTTDLTFGASVARRVNAGTVFINSMTKSDPRLPFGGVRKSGVGRELSHFGIREFVNIKGINLYSAVS